LIRKILFLCDFERHSQGRRWLWDYIPGNQDEVDFLYTHTNDRYARWGKLFAYYPAYVKLAFQAYRRTQRHEYDLIVAWESDTGFPVGLFRRLLRQTTPPLAILTFSMRGPLVHFPWLQRLGVAGADFLTVASQQEVLSYTQTLRLAPGKIQYCPYGVYDIQENDQKPPLKDFIFSGGRSGRDYATLFAALRELDEPVVIAARPFNLQGLKIPANVTVHDLLPFPEFARLNRQSRFVVVPLLDVPEAVGITSVLYAMAAGKAVIASRVPGITDYVEDGKSGLLIKPGDPAALRQAILHLWQNPAETERLGRIARRLYQALYTFEAFARRTVRLLDEFMNYGASQRM
jgi:glycosyltransferase involved in cell wall biosynthesis